MVQLSEDAYRALRRLKRADESFSDLITRLTRSSQRRIPLQGLKSMRTDAERDEHLRWLREMKDLDLKKQEETERRRRRA
jgi:predicted CopG family antitoxin